MSSYLSYCDALLRDRILRSLVDVQLSEKVTYTYVTHGVPGGTITMTELHDLRIVCVWDVVQDLDDPEDTGYVRLRLVVAPCPASAKSRMQATVTGLVGLCETHPVFLADAERLLETTMQGLTDLIVRHIKSFELVNNAIRATPVWCLRGSFEPVSAEPGSAPHEYFLHWVAQPFCNAFVFHDMLLLSHLPEAFLNELLDIMSPRNKSWPETPEKLAKVFHSFDEPRSSSTMLTAAVASGTTSLDTVLRACNSLCLLFGENSFLDKTGNIRAAVCSLLTESGAHRRLFVYIMVQFWMPLCEDRIRQKFLHVFVKHVLN